MQSQKSSVLSLCLQYGSSGRLLNVFVHWGTRKHLVLSNKILGRRWNFQILNRNALFLLNSRKGPSTFSPLLRFLKN
jgi:hypothetical protein